MPSDPQTTKSWPWSASPPRQMGCKDAYEEACRIIDRDHAAGVDDMGIIDNVLARLAELAGVKP